MAERHDRGEDLALLDAERAAEPRASETLERVLELVDVDPADTTCAPPQGLWAARICAIDGDSLEVEAWDGTARYKAELAPFVQAALVDEALADGRLGLVDARGGRVMLIGFIQTSRAEVSRLSGRDIEIEATHEISLRSGRAALRLRADGTVELLGTRINAVSRGVLRLLGRALRLN